jgi:UDP-N-acetylglucosamine 1-carboxyvinyltransferase
LKALRNLGARIFDIQNGFLYAEADKLKGCEIQLDYPSVGATENIMITATFAEGETIIRNAAKEPEIVDLQNFLIQLGADVQGAGSGMIRIQGSKSTEKFTKDVEFHKDLDYTIMPDRIVAGTYMVAAAITGGELLVNNVIPEHVSPMISLLRESGCKIHTSDNTLNIVGPVRPKCIELIRTLPYPGFPTDMQPQMVSLLTVSKGTGIVVETVFESRYKHVNELIKMGANIKIEGRLAIIRGVKSLKGADVTAWDLRGGAAMILAGLAAEGRTVVNDSKHIERGYEDIEKCLTGVGASIQKVL